MFAHSSNGIQTMVLELPLSEHDPQTIIVQYVLFSPLANARQHHGFLEQDEDMEEKKQQGPLQVIYAEDTVFLMDDNCYFFY